VGAFANDMKRSALFYLHQRAGARFGEHQGWEVPASFVPPEREAEQVRKSVGLADLSHLLKFDLRKQPQQRGWRLGANHYLMMSEPPLDPPPGAIDVSSGYTSLRLAGPRSSDVLSKLTSLNVSDVALPNQSCAQASLAHTHAIVLREDIGSLSAFHLLVSREFGEAVWESFVHAGHEFDLCPFGLQALAQLHG
jgi:glycine cleavage system aminomethyltransferase T